MWFVYEIISIKGLTSTKPSKTVHLKRDSVSLQLEIVDFCFSVSACN